VTLKDIQTISDLKKEISGRYTFEDIVSKNREIREIFDIMPHLAETDTTVLIEGKSGTGKELFARAIHNLSRRREGPFVAVNCAALPENLLESEMFGHVKGAFTDAVRDKPGRFTRAQGGTILLDEIAELPLALQGKLLRVLQEREYEPLGSVTPMRADVRIIASTNKDLASEVENGHFREDLFYRLNVVNIAIPPLKDRREDIPLLVEHFIDKISRKLGADHMDVSEDFMTFLMNYDFPGNVRELENIIEHAYVLCRGPSITTDYLPRELKNRVIGTIGDGRSLRAQQEDAERRHIEQTLIRFGGNKTRTARALNMDRTTLWRKMKRYQMLEDDI
jgi:transcriptional regulator with PAS, ATPase and Fis domain